MNKKIFTLIFVLYSSYSLSQNTIVGIYNEDIITLKQLEKLTKKNESKERKISVIQTLITEKIEFDFIKKFKIVPTSASLNNELSKVAEQNKISLEKLKQLANYNEIYSIVFSELSKIGLRQVIVNRNKAEPISINSKEGVSLYQDWLKKTKENMYIEIFEDKL